MSVGRVMGTVPFPAPSEVEVVLEVEPDEQISCEWLRGLIRDARAWEESAKEAA